MADKINSLWKRLAEMFGAKALESKFGATPPDTWRMAVDRLKDYELERGMRRLVYGGKGHVPTLPEFLRMCREVGGDEFVAADHKPVPPSHQLEAQPLPKWDREASEHLMCHIWRKAYDRVRIADSEVPYLVEAKNYWAQDMRERDEAGDRPQDNGKALWAEYIANAEAAIAASRKAA